MGKPLLDQNKFLWVKDGLISIWQDLLMQEQSLPCYSSEKNDKSLYLIDIERKMAEVFNIQSIKNFEHDKKPGEEIFRLIGSLCAEKYNPEVLSLLAGYDPVLAYIYSINCNAKEAAKSYGLNFNEKIILIPVIASKTLKLELTAYGVFLDGVSDLFPSSLAEQILLILPGYISIVLPQELDMEQIPTIGFRGGKFAIIKFKKMKIELSRLQKITPVQEENISRAARLSYNEILMFAEGAGKYLLKRSYEHASTRIQFPQEMMDTYGEEGIIKFGAVKKYLSEMEIQLYVLKSLIAYTAKNNDCIKNNEEIIINLCSIIAICAFGPKEGSFGYNAGQVFGGLGYSEDDLLAKFYRDSSFFRQLIGPEKRLILKLGRLILEERETYFNKLKIDEISKNSIIFQDLVQRYEIFLNVFNYFPVEINNAGAGLAP
ncbi:acyl-CoA/acyl-ACP dehydrogenase, partial [Candidatus Desantisbacteria bacterium]|nr:acyl-CoA/acyl-ACP dehydrogenase [Candidatus Desantisbacteria bacterium]